MTPYIDTYERILTAARELIHARSYADVGVAAICEQAKVKKGSFYHFFPSKQELTLAILDSLFVETKEQLFDQVLKKSDLPPLVRLQKLGAAFYTVQSQIKTQTGHVPGCPIGNLASEMSTQDETIRRKIDSIFQKLQSAFQQILTEAVAIGDSPAHRHYRDSASHVCLHRRRHAVGQDSKRPRDSAPIIARDNADPHPRTITQEEITMPPVLACLTSNFD